MTLKHELPTTAEKRKILDKHHSAIKQVTSKEYKDTFYVSAKQQLIEDLQTVRVNTEASLLHAEKKRISSNEYNKRRKSDEQQKENSDEHN